MSVLSFDFNFGQPLGQNPAFLNKRAGVPENFHIDLKDDKTVTANVLTHTTSVLVDRMYCVHRHIETAYLDLPWPDKVHNIVVYTHIVGGYGDIAASAKLIFLIKKVKSNLTIEWVLKNYNCENDSSVTEFANNFLQRDDVFIRTIKEKSTLKSADMLIVGPACDKREWYENQRRILLEGIEITGPIFEFREIGDYKPVVIDFALDEKLDVNQAFTHIYSKLFPYQTCAEYGIRLLMGIRPGCGVFLDEIRLSAHLSNIHSCPSYLSSLQDKDLAFDIFSSEDSLEFNAEQNSFNFGYSHLIRSRKSFIDCVALAETEKNVVLVINQKDFGEDLTDDQIITGVFSKKRVRFLEDLGFSDIFLKTSSSDHVIKDGRCSARKFTLITRGQFSASDFKNLQLAAERILATGDNSAIEAICARCKMYVYEYSIHKQNFLNHQVDIANIYSKKLGDLIHLLSRSYNDRIIDEKESFRELLLDPDLEKDTLAFCDHISKNFSFEPILEASLKRAAWMSQVPDLLQIEIDSFSDSFKEFIVQEVVNAGEVEDFELKDLPVVYENVHSKVKDHIENGSVLNGIFKMFF